jgi:hypothetical protein
VSVPGWFRFLTGNKTDGVNADRVDADTVDADRNNVETRKL